MSQHHETAYSRQKSMMDTNIKEKNKVVLSLIRQVDRKIRGAFYTNDTRIFYAEQFITDDFSLEDVLRTFQEMEWVAKISITVDAYIDKNLVFSGSPYEYVLKYADGKYSEHTTYIRAEITPEYADELIFEKNLRD